MASKSRQKSIITAHHIVIFISVIAIAVITMYFKTSEINDKGIVEAKKETWNTSYIACTRDLKSADKTPPSVKILDPLNGGIIPKGNGTSNVKVVAVATDHLPLGEGDTKSSFYVNGVVKDIMPYELISSGVPYDFYWGAPNKTAGKTYSFQVKVCDAAGNEAWSPVVKVTTAR